MKTITKLTIGLATLVGVATPIITTVSCAKIPDQPIQTLTGGSTHLTGTAGSADTDNHAWILKNGEQEITQGVTMTIVPISSSTGQFPTWISVGGIEGYTNYHKVSWSNAAAAGTYHFTVRATTTDTSVSPIDSPEITLIISPMSQYVISGLDVKTVGLVATGGWHLNEHYKSDEIGLSKDGETIVYDHLITEPSDSGEAKIITETDKKMIKATSHSFQSEQQAKEWTQKINLSFYDENNNVITTINNIKMCAWEACHINGLPSSSEIVEIGHVPDSTYYSNNLYATNPITLTKDGADLPVGTPSVVAINKDETDISSIIAWFSSEHNIKIPKGAAIYRQSISAYNTMCNTYGTCKCTIKIRYHNNDYTGQFSFKFKAIF